MMRLILIGPPAAGKGTQAARLAQAFSIVHLSTGQMLREALAAGTELGKAAAEHWLNGGLAPDEIVIPMLIERIGQPDCRAGFLIDGFPRTVPQAAALDASLSAADVALDAVLLLEVPEEEIFRRITGRRLDPVTDKTYHLLFDPPPAEIADRLVMRDDDTLEACELRLKRYRRETEPVIPRYEAAGKLVRINGLGSPDEVTQRILSAFVDTA